MEFQYKKNVVIKVNLEVGEEILIKGWGHKLDGKHIIEDIRANFGKCESGIQILIKGRWLDSGWADKI